jgi:DNA-binding response OmpR family regulator
MQSTLEKIQLLVVEDQKTTLQSLKRGLREQGYTVDTASDGLTALAKARKGQYEALLLDLGLPGMDGLTLLRTIRKDGLRLPVLALTARDSVESKIEGLDCGADDYLVKPFSFDELCARLRSLLRRSENLQSESCRVGDLEISPSNSTVCRAGTSLD